MRVIRPVPPGTHSRADSRGDNRATRPRKQRPRQLLKDSPATFRSGSGRLRRVKLNTILPIVRLNPGAAVVVKKHSCLRSAISKKASRGCTSFASDQERPFMLIHTSRFCDGEVPIRLTGRHGVARNAGNLTDATKLFRFPIRLLIRYQAGGATGVGGDREHQQ